MAAQRRKRPRISERPEQRRSGTHAEPEPPTLFGPWRILRPIGEGAHGVVYEAEHEHIPSKRVALKILHRHHYSELARRLFFREAQAASCVAHPGIVQVYDVGTTTQGHCYLVMELIHGLPLSSIALPINLKRALGLLQQIALAMAEVHAHGVIHRDLKPQNVMIESLQQGHQERARILDFGVAKLVAQAPGAPQTASGALLGTPAYMSREQWISPNDIDFRTDIYAIGIMAYEILVGRLPFHGRTPYDWQQAHLRQPVPQNAAFRALPRQLQKLLLAMLAKHRDDRPSDMLQVASELAQIEDRVLSAESAARPAQRSPRNKGAADALRIRSVAWGTGLLLLQFLSTDQGRWATPSNHLRGTADLQRSRRSAGHWKGGPTVAGPQHRASAFAPTDPQQNEEYPPDSDAIEMSTIRGAAVSSVKKGAGDTQTLAHPPSSDAVSPGTLEPSDDGQPALAKSPELWHQFRRWLLGSWTDPGTEATKLAAYLPRRDSSAARDAPTPHVPKLLLAWRVSPPSSSQATLRILADGQPVALDGASVIPAGQPGWVRYTQDRWLLNDEQLSSRPTRYSVEVRDGYGCWVGAGSTDVQQPMAVDDIYVPIDVPNDTDHTRLEIKRVVAGSDTSGDGLAMVESSEGLRLLDCGTRCRCVLPRSTALTLTGQGSERHPFVAWETTKCEGQNPCKTTAGQLVQPGGAATVTARYATWDGEGDGFQTLRPPLVALSTEQHRFFQTQLRDRKKAEYSNPSQLRTLSAPINGSLWMAGRGGTLVRWDAERRAFRRMQMGNISPMFPPADGVQSPQPRLLDFFGIAEDRNQRAYAVGAEDLGRDMDPMANAYHFDGETWTQDLFVAERTLTQHHSLLLGRRVLRSVLSSLDGSAVIAVGLDGNIIERGVGLLANPDRADHKQNLWIAAGDPRSHMLVGAEVRSGQQPILLHRRGVGPFELVADPPPFGLRTAWASPDGSEFWVGGMSRDVVRYIRGPRGGLVRAETPCTYGAAAPAVILGIWGAGPDDVWVVGGDRVWHCAGQGKWEVAHQLDPGYEFVGLQGERGRDLWAVGFLRSLAANPNAPIDPERTDRSLIIRLPHGGVQRQ